MTGCSCNFLDAKRAKDPTRTTPIRRKWENDLVSRFKDIRSLIREAIVTLDVLGLGKAADLSQKLQSEMFLALFTPKITKDAKASPPPKGAWASSRSQDKVNSFMEWLYSAQRQGILEVQLGTPMRQAANNAWQNVYIDSSYQRGIRDAYGNLKEGGYKFENDSITAAFNRPIHADRVGLVYTRAYNDLEGINDVMSQQISRVLAQGVAEGRGPMEIARNLQDRVDKVGITRARLLARTETIAAHAEATLNSYAEAGVEGVSILAEFQNAGDDVVCPECEELEGKEMSIDEARGLIPVHPNCRCAFLPVVQEPSVPSSGDPQINHLREVQENSVKGEFTGEELDQIQNYVDGSGELNEALRRGAISLDYNSADMVEALDGIFERVSLSESMTVYRGASKGVGKALFNAFDNAEEGLRVIAQDNGFVSTSLTWQQASQFAAGTRVDIDLGKGSAAFPLGSNSNMEQLQEVLINRGQRFEIYSADRTENGGYHIKMRIQK